ncbi:HAMP domain-containing histidine kinase [Lysinibacillus sphaericus]|uniref:histidine kinase n=2 Tax=Lysinibacillus TaxID=400634 RepID=A0A2S0K0S2_LYSSH|nr:MULTISPECIES: HAMP domain-containing sensor histidine kinase [Lysinibacillus]AHN21904.1 histidine kinase [Lysinibacillus varians]AVK96908.1 two-component sensor histidine kinase [Lysinibacillus sphaericus]MCS1381531.1 HAMP domain-containing histidine kinase [Lysinibacillus sphaericus]MED4542182.1 HAMP domain-containing sensor histidine kinase [Lysinibacillus sphaericus]TKI20527.1 HAMP domain-containing histidine kinase [Lysinibacillus sphaericus]
MAFFKANKVIDRLNKMIDNAIEGRPIENGFDESKLSALETKLSHYLTANSATKIQLADEKSQINQLISDISHQTKTPLANILLYTQLLAESELSDYDQNCVAALTQQAEKLNFLISSLVKASRLETGIITVTPTNNNVANMLETVIEQATPKAIGKNIALTVDSRDVEAVFDPKWTVEALYNIVDNAIKYTPSGGSVQLSVTPYQLFCRIDVADTGLGISEDETAKIFSRFYRSQEVTDKEGVGLGLYLAREIITAQGGYIKVKSRLGVGSVFSVFLPIKN